MRTDNGLEFVNDELTKIFNQFGVKHELTVPYTPQQNGGAEREMRTVMELARTMLYAKEMQLKFWAEAVNTAVYVLNRTGTSTVAQKTPYELWYGQPAKFNHLRSFGEEVYVHLPKEKRRKLDAKSWKGIFIGYADNHKAMY